MPDATNATILAPRGDSTVDAVLILFDRSEHPATLADTALALRSLKGVWHTELLRGDALADVAAIRRSAEVAVEVLGAERLRQVGAL